MTALRGLVMLVAPALLASCGSVQARRLATTPEVLKSGQSILMLSTSAEESCFFSWQVDIYPAGSFRPVAALAINHSSLKSDFPDRVGFFDAYVLQPGDYDLRVVSSVGEVNPHFAGDRYLGPSIRLRPGEMKYAGHVQVGRCRALSPAMRNEWTTVLPKFRARFPQLDMNQVVVPRTGERPRMP
jgi:hypothetical protein